MAISWLIGFLLFGLDSFKKENRSSEFLDEEWLNDPAWMSELELAAQQASANDKYWLGDEDNLCLQQSAVWGRSHPVTSTAAATNSHASGNISLSNTFSSIHLSANDSALVIGKQQCPATTTADISQSSSKKGKGKMDGASDLSEIILKSKKPKLDLTHPINNSSRTSTTMWNSIPRDVIELDPPSLTDVPPSILNRLSYPNPTSVYDPPTLNDVQFQNQGLSHRRSIYDTPTSTVVQFQNQGPTRQGSITPISTAVQFKTKNQVPSSRLRSTFNAQPSTAVQFQNQSRYSRSRSISDTRTSTSVSSSMGNQVPYSHQGSLCDLVPPMKSVVPSSMGNQVPHSRSRSIYEVDLPLSIASTVRNCLNFGQGSSFNAGANVMISRHGLGPVKMEPVDENKYVNLLLAVGQLNKSSTWSGQNQQTPSSNMMNSWLFSTANTVRNCFNFGQGSSFNAGANVKISGHGLGPVKMEPVNENRYVNPLPAVGQLNRSSTWSGHNQQSPSSNMTNSWKLESFLEGAVTSHNQHSSRQGQALNYGSSNLMMINGDGLLPVKAEPVDESTYRNHLPAIQPSRRNSTRHGRGRGRSRGHGGRRAQWDGAVRRDANLNNASQFLMDNSSGIGSSASQPVQTTNVGNTGPDANDDCVIVEPAEWRRLRNGIGSSSRPVPISNIVRHTGPYVDLNSDDALVRMIE